MRTQCRRAAQLWADQRASRWRSDQFLRWAFATSTDRGASVARRAFAAQPTAAVSCESERLVADRAAVLESLRARQAPASVAAPGVGLDADAARVVADTLRRDGMVKLPLRCDPQWLASAKETASRSFQAALRAAKACGSGVDVGLQHGFAEIVQRTSGRYDMRYGIDGAPDLQQMCHLWQPVIQELLGGREDLWKLEFNGLLMTLPGAAEQAWHVDGEHLFFEQHGKLNNLPPHCVNVFVPLVPLNEIHGGTEFCLTSQSMTDGTDDIVWQDNAWKEKIGFNGPTKKLHVDEGDIVLFDYRVLHRGLAHCGEVPRPVLYWTYTRRWFSDSLNMPPRSLNAALGGVDQTARSCFPALQCKEIFADGAAGTQVPQAVADAVSKHLLQNNANVGGSYRTSVAALETVSGARQAAAALLGADSRGIVFGLNCTNIMMHLSRCLSKTLRPGDNVVVSAACHDANVAPWLLAARDAGAEVRTLPSDPSGKLQVPDGVVDGNTRIVAVGLASNATGALQNVQALTARARSVGAVSILDGTHFVPHRRTSLGELGADALVCSGYKFFGPHMGVMAARVELLERLEPYKVGWRAEGDRLPCGLPTPDYFEISKWEMGTLAYEALAGFEAAVHYLASLAPATAAGQSNDGELDLAAKLDGAFARIEAHEEALSTRFLDGIAQLQQRNPRVPLKLVGPAAPSQRTPTFSFASSLGDKLCEELVARGIFCSHGNHYAPVLVEEVAGHLEGLTRISLMHYNTFDEVDRILAALDEITR